jgi:acetylornithine deacetylase/succinyl-diaminopimelate desuccinylase-like protein
MSLSNASIVRVTNSEPLIAARQIIQQGLIVQRAIAIQQIPAPTFAEQKRAAFVEQVFRDLPLHDVHQDNFYNVYGWLPGTRPDAPVLLVAAHTDTVFPVETDLSIRQETDRIYGAGLGDNSLGVAALWMLAELFTRFAIPHEASICFLANSREEGLGNLEGINGALDFLDGRLGAVIVLEGMALGRIYHSGIAVRRYKVTVTAPGGHSWLHFGASSAIHSLMRFGADFSRISVSENPRTTYNIGLVEGGSSINTIASQAACFIDLRSEDTAQLEELDSQMRDLAEQHSDQEVHFQFEQVGSRPAGSIPEDHPLVQLAKDAHHAIHMIPEIESGSTDTNAPLARGIPAVCVGITYGGNAHSLDEYIETPPLEDGMWQLLLLTVAASNAVATW